MTSTKTSSTETESSGTTESSSTSQLTPSVSDTGGSSTCGALPRPRVPSRTKTLQYGDMVRHATLLTLRPWVYSE
ncbi:hypothetical protein L914_10092 [Phytophthora nicotianae]|uniref:Uncharacterized protein n=1 Tax=Phytophthora nicotianae TaxID=4792 RepID=W2N7X5_PHYNI|nr:hypothetical protein L914_10092 [Phytophthora nicotianae]